jgi:hypothetical protein
MKHFLTIVVFAFLALTSPALADDMLDGTEPSPIWQAMLDTGMGYNFDTGEFFVLPTTHEGEVSDPYIYDESATGLLAGTYLMPDGSLLILPEGIPVVWF